MLVGNKNSLWGKKDVEIPIGNIVSYWKVNNNVIDSKLLNNATALNIAYTSGFIGQSAIFNGINSSIDINDSDSLSFTDGVNDLPFSISIKLKYYDKSGAIRFIFSKRDNATQNEYQLTSAGDSFKFWIFSGSSSNSISCQITPTIPLNEWVDLTITYDGSKSENGITIYYNNTILAQNRSLVGTYTGMVNGNNLLSVGRMSWSTSSLYRYKGEIDELIIFNKKLEYTEVEAIDITQHSGNELI